MKFSDRLASLNRLQQSRGFKIVASCVVVALCIAAVLAYSVTFASRASESIITPDSLPLTDPRADADGSPPVPRPELDATERIVNDILGTKQSIGAVTVGVTIFGLLAIMVVWLGLGLSYLALALLGVALAVVCIAAGRGADLGIAAAGLVGLFAAFAALMQALRLAFAGSGPVMAVARLVLAEAMRMKVSIIFIILVVLGLCILPITMDQTQPLRYRVQSFLQFSTAGSFWLIAILVLSFCVSTVTLEQRDKIIWQTMTKPVKPWEYILGKWLGVSSLAAALLVVSATGIFAFTEYLRAQPAVNEKEAFVASAGEGITEDRLILETQVLTARTVVRPEPLRLNEEQFQKNIEARIRAEMAAAEATITSPEVLRAMRQEVSEKVEESLRKEVQIEYRAIPPGGQRTYRFLGLGAARDSNRPLIFRFKFDSGSNRPDEQFRVTFSFTGTDLRVQPVTLGQFQSIPVSPIVVDSEGGVTVGVINGDRVRMVANPSDIVFSPNAMEISYSSGGFRTNFFKCIAVLWLKLAFLAMLAIFASTFLSFPVACLVAFAVFLAAEGATFISNALENYSTEDHDGKTLILQTVVAKIAEVVSGAFRVYSDLRPTARIVDGLALSWMEMAGGIIVLSGATLVLFAGAVYIFRRRELATYSGH